MQAWKRETLHGTVYSRSKRSGGQVCSLMV